MMFFKSKPRAEKLDNTLTTKLDKIFQYFKAKEELSERLFARNHKVAPMAIATYWHYGKANLDESELLENTGLSDLYQPLELLLTKTMKLPCITRIEFEEENWVQLFLSIDFKLNPTDSSLFRVFVFPDQDSFVFAETDQADNLFQNMMQAKPFNQHSPHYEKFLSSVDAVLNAIEKPEDFTLLDQKLAKIEHYLKNQPDGDLLVKNNVFETDIYAYQFYYSDNWDDYSKEKFNELDFGGDMYDLQSQFCNPMGFVPASREEFFNGSGYSFLNIGFGIKPHKEYEHIIKETEFEFPQRIELFAGQPIRDAAYSLQHTDKLFISNLMAAIYYAKPLDEQHYKFDLLKQAVDLICDSIDRRETEINQDALFDELITLLETKKYIKAKYIKQVKSLYKWLNKDLEKCREKMIAFGDIYEDEDFDEEYAKLELIRSYLHCYQDDWKIDYDSLNHFLSEALEQPFEITFEEAKHEFARIKAKVEAISDYTLLYVDTGSDNFYCLVCPKSAAPRIIEIADILNLPINH